MMFLSGVFFPLDTLPEMVKWIAWCLPLTHAVALVRPLFMDAWPDQAGLHLGVLTLYASAAWWIALTLTRKRFKQ
jgi:lipooligosaccharide transport system permease protein